MHTVEQMREAIGELIKRLGEIDAKCVQENREYTDEERKEIRRIQVRIKDLEEQIDLMEETKKLTLDADKSINEPTKPDPNASPDNRAASGRDTRITPGDGGDKFRSFGEFLVAVMQAANPSPRFDPRLRAEARATGLSEGVASEGGYVQW